TDPALAYSDNSVVSAHFYQYRYVVFDKVGNSTTYTTSAVAEIDTEPPTAALTDPGANLRQTVNLTAVADDTGGSGVNTITFQKSAAGANTWTPIAQAWDTTQETDGLYDLRVVVTDRASNSTTSTLVTGRRVDNTPPSASLTDPGPYLAGTVNLTGTSSDSGSGVDTVTYQRATAGGSDWATIPAAWDTTTTPDGSYDLRLVVVDKAGNQTISSVASRLVDNTRPSAAMNDPGSVVRGTVSLSSTTSDAGSGVKSVAYQRSTDGTTWTDTPASWDTT